jgi:hypothetical protein
MKHTLIEFPVFYCGYDRVASKHLIRADLVLLLGKWSMFKRGSRCGKGIISTMTMPESGFLGTPARSFAAGFFLRRS